MKRFYKDVATGPVAGGWQVLLDGRTIKTAGRNPQILPSRPLAEALAAEWAAQGDQLDAAGFGSRDMADYAIDMVAADPADAVAALLKYGETDTLCYRADPDEPLWRRQQALWEPLLQQAEARLGVQFVRVSGIIHRPQDPATLVRLRAELHGLSPFALAALRSLSGLAASLVIGLAALEDGADLHALWDAANLEEDFQVETWGEDAEAAALRARRGADFLAAARFAALASQS